MLIIDKLWIVFELKNYNTTTLPLLTDFYTNSKWIFYFVDLHPKIKHCKWKNVVFVNCQRPLDKTNYFFDFSVGIFILLIYAPTNLECSTISLLLVGKKVIFVNCQRPLSNTIETPHDNSNNIFFFFFNFVEGGIKK
jgi:hypothetical protein